MNLNPRTNRATVSIERGSPGKPMFRSRDEPKRNSQHLTDACSRSAPWLHGHYPLPRYYGLSDSRRKKTLRVSQVPRPICPHAPPPTTPESPMAALSVTRPSVSGFIRSDGLATPNTLTRLNRVRLRCGSQVCLARLRVADCSHSTRLRGYVDERIISTVNSFQFTR